MYKIWKHIKYFHQNPGLFIFMSALFCPVWLVSINKDLNLWNITPSWTWSTINNGFIIVSHNQNHNSIVKFKWSQKLSTHYHCLLFFASKICWKMHDCWSGKHLLGQDFLLRAPRKSFYPKIVPHPSHLAPFTQLEKFETAPNKIIKNFTDAEAHTPPPLIPGPKPSPLSDSILWTNKTLTILASRSHQPLLKYPFIRQNRHARHYVRDLASPQILLFHHQFKLFLLSTVLQHSSLVLFLTHLPISFIFEILAQFSLMQYEKELRWWQLRGLGP